MSQYTLLIGLLLVLFAVAVLVAYLIARIKELSEQVKEYEKNIAVLNEQMDKSAYERAQKLFEEWKEKELEKLKDGIKKEYENLFEKWKNEYEEKIREDVVKKSLSTILGKAGEEIKLNQRILGISEPPLTMLLLKGYLIRIGKKR